MMLVSMACTLISMARSLAVSLPSTPTRPPSHNCRLLICQSVHLQGLGD